MGRMLLLLFLSAGPLFADATFHDCTIAARLLWNDTKTSGLIEKWYSCSGTNVRIGGTWEVAADSQGVRARKEFGSWWFGETPAFGELPKFGHAAFTECKTDFLGSGRSNYDGYMSLEVQFQCKQGRVLLRGQWGEEYQGTWEYHLTLGEVDSAPSWVENQKKSMEFLSFQKWCPTKNGYRLCGWIEEKKIDHGAAPPYKR